jgi:hypothetical protein
MNNQIKMKNGNIKLLYKKPERTSVKNASIKAIGGLSVNARV